MDVVAAVLADQRKSHPRQHFCLSSCYKNASSPSRLSRVISKMPYQTDSNTDLISAGLAGLFEMGIQARVAVATSVLLADFGQLLHPGPGCCTDTH